MTLAWSRPGLPLRCNLAGPIQHFKAAILDACGTRLQLIFVVGGRVFEVGPCWMYMALCSSLTLLMFGIEIRVCFGLSWLGVCGTVFAR